MILKADRTLIKPKRSPIVAVTHGADGEVDSQKSTKVDRVPESKIGGRAAIRRFVGRFWVA